MLQKQSQAKYTPLRNAGYRVYVVESEGLYRAAEHNGKAGLRTDAGIQFNKTFL